ncbi:MAG: endonuclease/exonuclease/phosphatase family protein [Fibrobacterota bacterium]|nr:endonuclease/exonuclease/phosphatase family protein [Fibrobacterota bacterium]QQS04846.1 MAG: endonuclease/exonuclease/phosphatase family protein [Fibrobacterota bacterium]
MRTSPFLFRVFAASLALAPLVASAGSIHRSPHLIEGPVRPLPDSIPSRFTLVSWNTHKENHPGFLADLGALVDTSRADLVLLQEARVDSNPSALQSALSDRIWHLSANLAGKGVQYGVLTASSALPLEATPLLSKAGEPVARTRKASLVTRYRIAKDTLCVANVHALNFSPNLSGFRGQLVDLCARLRAHTGPLIVAGDFNTWSDRKQNLSDSVLGSIGLVRFGFGDQSTRRTSRFGHPLDHVYFHPAYLEVDTSWVQVRDSIASSDHAPLVVPFRLRR